MSIFNGVNYTDFFMVFTMMMMMLNDIFNLMIVTLFKFLARSGSGFVSDHDKKRLQ